MPGLKYKIYNSCPVWLQNILVSAEGLKFILQRYGPVYKAEYKRLIEKGYSSREEEESNQNKQLHEFIQFAVKKSKFYQEFYNGIDVSHIQTVRDLTKLPVLEKEMLRENVGEISTINQRNGIKAFTGGTTGKSIVVVFTKDDFQKRLAYLDAFKAKLGVVGSMRKATFSGREIISPTQKSNVFWRYNLLLRQRLYSTFHLSEQNISFYIKDLNKFRPETMNGFVSAFYEISQYILKYKITLEFKPRAIFTTSETLLPLQRESIEKAFDCPVYNQYASAEGAPFITECSKHNLHYNLDTGVIEFLPDGEILVTSFTTHGTPLIRYRIGDMAHLKDGECACGCAHPLVSHIEGRSVDFLYSPEKGKISMSHLADVIKGLPGTIKAMQFVQSEPNEIMVYIVADEKIYTFQQKASILNELRYRFGNNMKINLSHVTAIPRTGGGKQRLIVNTLKLEERNGI